VIRRQPRTDVASSVPERADWRFLLPGRPAGRLLWVGPDDRPVPSELAASMDVTLARRRSQAHDPGEVPDAERFDVVAIMASRGTLLRTRANWGAPLLGRMTRHLRRGGQLYLEVDRPGALVRPGSVTQRLEALGYEDVGLYWPVRGFERPDLYLPLDDRRPQRHYLDRLLWRGSLARRLVRLGLHVALRRDRLGLVVPRYVVVARLGPRPIDAADLAPGLLATIRSAWPALTGDEPAPGRISWLLQSTGMGGDGKLICPTWRDGDLYPSVVLKVARGPDGDARIEAENLALAEVSSHADHQSIQVPRPLGSSVLEGRRVSAETTVDGRPLSAYLAERPGSVASMAPRWEAWVDWLADLHVRSSRAASAADLDALLFDPMTHAATELALEPGEADVLKRLRSDAKALVLQHPLRVGFAHHDLGPSNVLVSDAGRPTAVIDWEAAGSGLPATDLLYFLGRLGDEIMSVRGPIDGWAFDSLFLSPGGLVTSTTAGRMARRWLGRYGAQLDLTPAWLPILLVACWTMHARNERRRRVPAGRDSGGPFRDRLRATLDAFDGHAGRVLFGGDAAPQLDHDLPSSFGDLR
jgi:aminoglycoside phosphotransferase (APT) family kinase protein